MSTNVFTNHTNFIVFIRENISEDLRLKTKKSGENSPLNEY
jgi:hypothetical protein